MPSSAYIEVGHEYAILAKLFVWLIFYTIDGLIITIQEIYYI